ncbi:MAG TPA: glycosyltransferase family 4 protein [Trinickia sp.]|jgi:glycosyltransferase involved in cell wall biosynthesis|uniref:glycosyltransferase family 4 protein n=1 Tax=Trinickia sp. TaxID=2571163 RepID=UPI002D0A36DF|nr:glycosyltransferase family 4 protein [Trinickia sp.]HTI17759.1 glycosyltransferase family 4 protein [Trinickia sp.]
MQKQKVVLLANTDWYLFNFRLPLAKMLRERGFEVILLSPDGSYGPRLRELGFCWEVMPMERRSLNPWREFGLVMWLARFFMRERPLLVHGFTIKGAVYGSIAARLANVPIRVNAIDGMGYVFTSDQLRARMLRPVVRYVMRSAFSGERSVVVLQNSDDVALFKQSRIAADCSLRLIKGAGVNLTRYRPHERSAQQTSSPLRILLAARLIREKGIGEYVEASRMLKGEGRSVTFLLAGSPDEGNPAAISRSQIEEWVREGLLVWLGHVSDMPKLLSGVDAVVLPSYYREGLPTTLIEGAACALPLITTDAPGCREVVSRNGDDGILIPARDAKALANAIRMLDDDRALGVKLGLAARKKALSEFDESIVLGKMLAIYHELGAPSPVTV